MLGLLALVKPLAHVMLLCITLGTMGFFCAIAITVLAADLLLTAAGQSPWPLSFGACAGIMLACALLRAVLRYGEQTCGHYIAFKLLAILRDKVFLTLRRLAPAKLEGRGRGDLISMITGDIELLEVFYAHTIAPVCIAAVVSAVMAGLIAGFHPVLGALAAAYLTVGVVIPLASARQIDEKTEQLNALQGEIKHHESVAASWAGAAVMGFTLAILAAGEALRVSFSTLLLTTVMQSASFGPVLALANLSGAMDQTLAAGERVLSLLEETPETEDVTEGETPAFTGAEVQDLSFAYGQEEILHGLTAAFPKGEIITVTGRSGSGKSTLLKLLMRFWRADGGSVSLSGVEIDRIQTDHLCRTESFMTQDTDLFHDSIGDNIRIGRLDATQEEVE